MVSRQLPNKSHNFDELTHEPAIWSCDTGQWLSCFDTCQLTILWMSNIKDTCQDTPETPPFLLIVSPTPPIQFVDACTYIRSVNHMTTKRKEVDHILWVWGSVPSMFRACGSPATISKWWRELMRRPQRYKKCWDNRNKDKRIITGRPHTVCLCNRFNCKFIVNVLNYIYRLLYL